MEFLYFFLGVVFILVLAPVIESIGTIILTGLEIVKGVWTLKVTKINAQIRKISLEYPDEPPSNPIGFVLPSSEEEEYDDEYDD